MADRVIGGFNMSSNYEVSVKKPLDARSVVPSYEALITKSNWVTSANKPIAYNGMLVAVVNTSDTSKNGLYFLFDAECVSALKSPNVELESNWIKITDISELATVITRLSDVEAELSEIDSLETRAKALEEILNGSEESDGLVSDVAKNTAAIAALNSLTTKVVEAVPTVDEAKLGIIYLVADEKAAGNYIEYILVDDGEVKSIEQIGSTVINLDDYVTTDELAAALNSYAKATEVVSTSTFEAYKTSTDAAILEVASETAKKADIAVLDSYYKASDADAKFISREEATLSLNSKADKETTYTKSEVNAIQSDLLTQVGTKADKATTYTKTEVNALLEEIEGGNSETVAAVARDLAAYESKNDAAVQSLETRVGTAKVGDVPATGLFAKIDNTQTHVDSLDESVAQLITITDANTAKLNGISTTVTQAIEDAIKTIPVLEVATTEKLGGIKSGSGNNVVSVDNEGIASVASVNANTLVQTAGEVLILNGGNTLTNV